MAFDPYREWLNLPGGRPHAFALLGISHRETSSEVIRRAADERLTRLRAIRPGEHVERWQQLMDEVAAARDLLLDAQKREAYLLKLKEKTAAAKAKKQAAGGAPPANEDSGSDLEEPSGHGGPAETAPAPSVPAPAPAFVPTPAASIPVASAPVAMDAAFDPMAPLTAAPKAYAPQPAPVAAMPAGDPFAPIASSPAEAQPMAETPVAGPVVGSAPGSIAARHRDYLQRRRMTRLILAGVFLLVAAIAGGAGYAYREPLLASLGIGEQPKPEDPASTDPVATETPATDNSGDSTNNTPADSNDSQTPSGDNSSTDSTETDDSSDDSSTDGSDSEMTGEGEGEEPTDDVTTLEEPETDPNAEMPEEGDPEMEDESMEEEMEPEMEEGEPRKLSRAEAFAVSQGASQVLAALRAGDTQRVEDRMSYLRLMTEGAEEAEWVNYLAEVVKTNAEYWEVVAECVGQLESTEDLEVTPDLIVKVVEASPERLIYRVSGTREERAPRDLPPGLARFIVEHVRQNNPDNGRLIGAMYAAESSNDSSLRDKAESAWREAETAGVDVTPLLDWLNADFDGLIKLHSPADAPTEEEITAAREQLETSYAEMLDAAKTPDAKLELGDQIFTEATTMESTPDAYVRFALAAELTAGSGHSTQLGPKITVWQTWFKIDQFTVLADLLPRCAKMSSDPAECKNTVEMAMQAAQQAAGRDRKEEALVLMDAAMDAAQKSKDAQLRNDTLMATRTLRARINQSE